MDAIVEHQGDLLVLALRGRFDFNAQRSFREGMERTLAQSPQGSVVVDLAGVDYMDSSALGMLLTLRERAREAGASVHLRGARGGVRQVLDIANFGRIFPLE